MSWLDIVLIVILAIIIFDGWRHGLLHFVSEFIGFGLGILFAVLFHDSLADKLGCISSRGVAEIVAFVIICLVVGVVAAVLSHLFLEPVGHRCHEYCSGARTHAYCYQSKGSVEHGERGDAAQ